MLALARKQAFKLYSANSDRSVTVLASKSVASIAKSANNSRKTKLKDAEIAVRLTEKLDGEDSDQPTFSTFQIEPKKWVTGRRRSKGSPSRAVVKLADLEVWTNHTLPSIHAQYSPKDIFNADETEFQYKRPQHALHFDERVGPKLNAAPRDKECLTLLLGASAAGEKLPLLLVGKSLHPRCFRHSTNTDPLPFVYRGNARGRMTRPVFAEWLAAVDRAMGEQGRRVALILDNGPPHGSPYKVKNVALFHLPPNSTADTQPMDCGVIQAVNTFYWRAAARRFVENEDGFHVDVLQAMELLADAWRRLPTATIVRCFVKSAVLTDERTVRQLLAQVQSAAVGEESLPDTPKPLSAALSLLKSHWQKVGKEKHLLAAQKMEDDLCP